MGTKPSTVASSKKESHEEQKFEKAYVVSAELGDRIITLFGELPRRLSPMVDALHMELQNCPRADITLTPPKETAEEK
jgi:hypothetical protein